MAIGKLGAAQYSLRVVQNGHVYKMIVRDRITISRDKNAPSKLTCSVLRNGITPECGNAVAFTLDGGHNQFYGYVVSTKKSKEWCDIECYDQLYYMNRNKMRMSYQNLSANEVCERICKQRQYGLLDPPQLSETGYKIKSRIEENVTDLEIITTALDLTYDNTGKRFYIWDDFGSVTIQSEGDLASMTNLVLTRAFMEDYSFDETLDGAWNAARVEVIKHEKDQTLVSTYTARDPVSVISRGFLEDVQQAEEGENPQHKANMIVANNLPPVQSLHLTGVQGDMTVRGGTPILVDFFTGERAEFIRGWFSVESVTHTIEDGYHTMDITATMLVNLNDWNNKDLKYYSYPSNTIK